MLEFVKNCVEFVDQFEEYFCINNTETSNT